jgi:putative two-component system response regulator
VLCRNLGVPNDDSRLIVLAAPLHDIGKIGIPDKILLKPGPLTRLEHDEMKKHTSIGADILSGGHSSILNVGVEIALSHHERWDGRGYPQAIKGEAIPLSARIVAVADVLDALSHDRPYKKAWDLDLSLDAVINGRGSQFDPDVIDALIRVGAPGIDEVVSVIDLQDDSIDGPQVDRRIGAG